MKIARDQSFLVTSITFIDSLNLNTRLFACLHLSLLKTMSHSLESLFKFYTVYFHGKIHTSKANTKFGTRPQQQQTARLFQTKRTDHRMTSIPFTFGLFRVQRDACY